jgi:predicted cytidylate kinase
MAVIRMSGYPGSGKTTLCKRLSGALSYRYYYAGGIFRAMAEKEGLSIEEFYKKLSSDPAVENKVDEELASLMRAEDNLLVEGRMAPFQPTPHKSINVLLLVSPEEGARRELLRPENSSRSMEEMTVYTRERIENERRHYKSLYGIEDHFDQKHFDVVIDTTLISPDEVFTTVIQKLSAFDVLAKEKSPLSAI